MTINPDAQGVFPITPIPTPAFGSRAMMEGMRSCVVCGIEFEIGTKVIPVAPEKGIYFAHREHFEEPIPEPPGKPKPYVSTLPCPECGNVIGHEETCSEWMAGVSG